MVKKDTVNFFKRVQKTGWFKVSKLFLSGLLLVVLCLSQQQAYSQNVNWIDYAESDDGSVLDIVSMESDGEGNTIVLGTIKGLVISNEVTFQSGYDDSGVTQINYTNIFLAKYDPDGNNLWLIIDEQYTNSSAYNLTIDSNNNIIIAGKITSLDISAPYEVNFEGETLESDNGEDFGILAKFEENGDLIWVNHLEGYAADAGLKAGPDGNIFMAAGMANDIIIGNETLTYTDVNDAFLAKFDSDGVLEWAEVGDYGNIFALDLDASGFIYTTGEEVLNKFSQSGIHGASITHTAGITGKGIKVSGSYLYLSGQYTGTVTLDDSTFTSQGQSDVFVTKYHRGSLSRSWLQRAGGSGTENVYGMALDKEWDLDGSQNVYVAGGYNNTLRFPHENTVFLTNSGVDGFVMKFESGGDPGWVQRFTSASKTEVRGITVSAEDRIFTSGIFNGEFKLEGETESTANNSGFIAELLEPEILFLNELADEVYGVNEKVELNYRTKGANNVRIGYTLDEGETWNTIQTITAASSPGLYEEGTVTWTVPDNETENVWIEIWDLVSPGPFDVTDSFEIKRIPIAETAGFLVFDDSPISQMTTDSVYVENSGFDKLKIDSLRFHEGTVFSAGSNSLADSISAGGANGKWIKIGLTGDDIKTFTDTLFIYHSAKNDPLKVALEANVVMPASVDAKFRHLGTFTQFPSYVNVLFQVTNPYTDDGITYLDKTGKAGFFLLKEGGDIVNPDAPETNFRVGKFDEVDYNLQTVMVLDNSRSLGQSGLTDLKQAALAFIDQLIEGQEIAIYVFAGNVDLVQDFSTDTDVLKEAINDIQLSETTNTNLYGATMEALVKIEENFVPELDSVTGALGGIQQAFLMVFTDGADNAGTFSLSEVVSERDSDNKQIFTVAFGSDDEINAEALSQLGNAGYFAVESSDQLNESFTQVQNRIRNLANSFYWLNYISPKRADGTQNITIELKDNFNTYWGTDSILETSFSSSGFTDVSPGITVNPTLNRISGIDTLWIYGNDPVDLLVETLFGTIESEYSWSAGPESYISLNVDSNEDTKAVTQKISDVGIITSFTVTDVPNYEQEPNLPFQKKIVVILDNETELTTSIARDFGSASSPQDYRLVGIPGEVSIPLEDILGGNTQWQAFWDNGSDENYLEKYDGSSTFTFKKGNGFWMTSTQALQYEEELDFAELNEDGQVEIPLHEGWNIISNPLTVDVPWDTVNTLNGGDLQPAWRFDGEFAETDTLFSSINGEAFYFLNDLGLEELLVPYISQSSGKAKSTSKNYLITLSTLIDDNRTSFSSVSYKDRNNHTRDVVAPLTGFEGASLVFTKEGNIQKRREAFYTSVSAKSDSDNQLYNLVLLSSGRQKVTLNISGDLQKFERALLINRNTGESIDLHRQESPEILPSSSEVPFVLVMGSSDYVANEQAQYLPKQIEISQNYPNPFNPTTTLRFSLPEQAQVRLQIFDILGRRVAMLVNGERQAGVYAIHFDASRYASGMYFAVFEIGNQRFTQKMMLIK